MSNVWIALGLTVFAGMATGIGSGIAFFAKRTDYRFLSVATGFSAGVMIYVSFVEILFKGNEALTAAYGETWGAWVNVASFFGGIAVIGLIDGLIPEAENPHEPHTAEERAAIREACQDRLEASGAADSDAYENGMTEEENQEELLRTGLFSALAIGIHNFPEGLATFLAALQDPTVGTAIAVAVALHNIPEGVSVSVPVYYATGERGKAFLYSALSGMSEPIGAAIAYVALRLLVGGEGGVMPPQVTGVLFAGVAGIMVYISLDELLPTSRAYGKGHDSLFGLLGGMAVMALSLLLMR
ncbi:MAG: zinc transporter ZupT [Chloroflexota bacterium]|nr:zinc transporter ZupT [Chloroflexota bacterium]